MSSSCRQRSTWLGSFHGQPAGKLLVDRRRRRRIWRAPEAPRSLHRFTLKSSAKRAVYGRCMVSSTLFFGLFTFNSRVLATDFEWREGCRVCCFFFETTCRMSLVAFLDGRRMNREMGRGGAFPFSLGDFVSSRINFERDYKFLWKQAGARLTCCVFSFFG